MKSSNDKQPDLDALFALARQCRPDTARAEFAFETRLASRLREGRPSQIVFPWTRFAWRLTPVLTACVVALALWSSELGDETNEAASLTNLLDPDNADAGSIFN